MSKGEGPAAVAPAGDTRNVSRVRRLSDLTECCRSAVSSQTLECRGIVAEIVATSDCRTSKHLVFEEITIILLHRGRIGAHFELASMSQEFTQGGILVLPPGTAVSFVLTEADCTVVYLRPDQLPGFDLEAFGGLEVVPQLDPVEIQLSFLLACVRDELDAEFPGGRRYMELGVNLGDPSVRAICKPSGTEIRLSGRAVRAPAAEGEGDDDCGA
jgi:hypothetical protein